MWGWASAVVLGLSLMGPAGLASPLGAVVTLEPLDDGKSQLVKAHTSVLTPVPCPLLDVMCEGTECVTHITDDPISGQYPTPGWCTQQWQSVVPFNYTSHQLLGSTDVVLTSWANLSVRSDNQKVNQPPIAALLPPLRVSVNCSQRFDLRIKDLDGDPVRCRYGIVQQRECQVCSRLEFLQLDEVNCALIYNGLGETGEYIVELMVEDFLGSEINSESRAMSSVPLQLSLIVGGESSVCQELPTFTERTPAESTILAELPYEEVKFAVEAQSPSEMISEIAVVGPPGLIVSELNNEPGSRASINILWSRQRKRLPALLPVCFTANTQSMQSEVRCVWIKKKPMDSLPPGTVLRCGDKDMNFSFPIASVPNLPLSDLQLNDPSCPITHNDTHVMGLISLNKCGTKAVHSGSDLVYTNTLRTRASDSIISRTPSLELRLSCHFPAVQVAGPHYQLANTSDEQVFGSPHFWLEVHPPGKGPLADQTQDSAMAKPLEHLNMLDLYIFSNTTLARSELMVLYCEQSPTPDFKETIPLVQSGCETSKAKLQDFVRTETVKVYRIDLDVVVARDNTMYIRCDVQLCTALLPSQKCPDQCTTLKNSETLVQTLFTQTYTIYSGPIFVRDRTPTSTTIAPTTTITTTTTPMNHAPDESFPVLGMAVTVVCMLLQKVFQ
ncbi:hypothetical protein GJAV_G00229020 [Gymnothorax javanicus]|nr:hypothetical protein GJAV_G00229020 [Gymnothorax javanicus]